MQLNSGLRHVYMGHVQIRNQLQKRLFIRREMNEYWIGMLKIVTEIINCTHNFSHLLFM